MAARYVSVPQQDGDITLTAGSGEPRTFRVDGGIVSAQTIAEEEALLLHVDGAKPATAKAVSKVKGAPADAPAPAAADTPDTAGDRPA